MTHTNTEQPEALQAIRALREYIEAIPKEIADALPAMPGVDGDWLDEVEQQLEASQAQRVPLTDGQIDEYVKYSDMHGRYAEPFARGVRWGIRHYERAHGITQEKQ